MASSHQVLADVLASTHQVAKRLLGRAGDPDRVKLSSEQEADQLLGVAAVGLYLVGRPARILPGAATTHSTPAASRARASP